MKTIAIAAAAALLFAGPAAAQDWSGWHVGADVSYTARDLWSAADGRLYYQGPSAGVSASHWWQVDPFYVGVEARLDLAGPRYSYSTAPGMAGNFWQGESAELWAASIRAKFGVSMGSALIYVAAGPKFISTENRSSWGGLPQQVSYNTREAWTAAIGLDTMVNQDWSVKTEIGASVFNYGRSGISNVGATARLGLTKHFR